MASPFISFFLLLGKPGGLGGKQEAGCWISQQIQTTGP